MPFDFLARLENLTPRNLTIREQTRLSLNPLDLRWRSLAPSVSAPSIVITELETVDFRPVGGRREWNAQGSEMPEQLGPRRVLEMVPINPTKHFDERKLQLLRERSRGMATFFQNDIIKDVDAWATALADACDRQVERDFHEAWLENEITVMDPKSGDTVTVAMGIDTARYVDETVPGWDDAGEDAYVNLLTHLEAGLTLMGSIGGARMRRSTLAEIVADAPALTNGTIATFGNINDLVSQEGFGPVSLVADERTYFAKTDGGSAGANQYYIPTGKIGFLPANGVVGRTHIAPVTRAYDFLSSAEIREGIAEGVTIFLSEKNDGKTLLEEAQMNAFPVPQEQYTYVVDAGV